MSKALDMGVYVVNCDVHKTRLKTFGHYARKAGMSSRRIACVNGRKMEKTFLCDMHKDGLLRATADMTAIEVAINLSHLAVWQRIARGKHSHGVVFEDDVNVHPDFVTKVNAVMKTLSKQSKTKKFGILFLWNGKWDKTTRYETVASVPAHKIEIEKMKNNYNAGAVAYILSKEMAAFLSDHDHFFPIREPQDIYMGNQRAWSQKWTCLSLKMKYDRKTKCYTSPVLDLECGGDWATGDSTQRHDDPKVSKMKCSKHKYSKQGYDDVISDKSLKKSFKE